VNEIKTLWGKLDVHSGGEEKPLNYDYYRKIPKVMN
jgi:hypothetical protein